MTRKTAWAWARAAAQALVALQCLLWAYILWVA